jgi:uncharacterized membrane protein
MRNPLLHRTSAIERIGRAVRLRQHNEGGATLVLVAVVMAVLLPVCAAFTLNLGQQVDLNRVLQQIADSGAVNATTAEAQGATAASILAAAQAAATNDGYTYSTSPSAAFPSVYVTESTVSGTWSQTCGWVQVTPPPATTPTNASCVDANKISTSGILVTAQSTEANLVHIVAGSSMLKRSAIGAVVPTAGLSIGTTVASFSTASSPILNQLFGAFGGSVSLSAIGYNGLLTGNVTLQQLMVASGVSGSTTILNPSNILSLGFTTAGWAKLIDAADPSLPQSISYGGSTASGCTVNDTTCLSVCDLANILPFCPSGILPPSDYAISLNVLQTLTLAAELSNGTSALSLTAGFNAPAGLNLGITSAQVAFSAITPPSIAYGPVGTTVTDTQVTATVSITSSLLLSILSGTTTIAATAGSGTATLNSVNCTNGALTSVGIGAYTTAASVTITVPVLNILGGLLSSTQTTTLTGSGSAASPNNLTFNAAAIPPSSTTQTATGNNKNPQTIGTTAPGLSTNLLSLGSLLTSVKNFVTGTLVSPILQALGISLANANVSALSDNCSSVAVVQ